MISFVVLMPTLSADSGFDSSYDKDSNSDSSGGGIFDILQILFYLFRLFITLWDVNPFLGLVYIIFVTVIIVFIIRYIFKNKDSVPKRDSESNNEKQDSNEETKEEEENDDRWVNKRR